MLVDHKLDQLIQLGVGTDGNLSNMEEMSVKGSNGIINIYDHGVVGGGTAIFLFERHEDKE